MNPPVIAGIIIVAAVALLVWCLCKVAKREWIREEPSTIHDCPTEPNCPRCDWYRAEHGRTEFPTCLRCSSDGTTCPKCDPFKPTEQAPVVLLRCGCECGCFLGCRLPEEVAAKTCAFCLTGAHCCEHGVAFCEECADCDAFSNVISIDSRRGT